MMSIRQDACKTSIMNSCVWDGNCCGKVYCLHVW